MKKRKKELEGEEPVVSLSNRMIVDFDDEDEEEYEEELMVNTSSAKYAEDVENKLNEINNTSSMQDDIENISKTRNVTEDINTIVEKTNQATNVVPEPIVKDILENYSAINKEEMQEVFENVIDTSRQIADEPQNKAAVAPVVEEDTIISEQNTVKASESEQSKTEVSRTADVQPVLAQPVVTPTVDSASVNNTVQNQNNESIPVSVNTPTGAININISLDGLAKSIQPQISNAPLKRYITEEERQIEEARKEEEKKAEQEKEENENKVSRKVARKVTSYLLTLAIIVGVVFLLKIFIVSIVPLKGNSMSPTYNNGDKLVVEKVSYYLGDPQVDDLVYIKLDNGTNLIKRVVGIPGDTIQIIAGSLYRNGYEVRDSFGRISEAGMASKQIKLGYDEYFVLGDNRNDSQDSRHIGVIDREQIKGKVLFRIWPLGKKSSAKSEKEAISGR